jgi:predicted RNA polymerase sigma factor
VEIDERLAARNAATLAQAQLRHDNAAEPEEADDTTNGLRYIIDEAEGLIGRAEQCMKVGTVDAMQAAIDYLKSAGDMLRDADWS